MSANMQKQMNMTNHASKAKVPTTISWNNSVFIPAVHFDITKNQMKDMLESNIGKVHRVDFVGFNSENGAGRRAFIHFDKMHETAFVKTVVDAIVSKGYFDMNYGPKMNWRMMPNKNPVPETEQTIQQVASNIDFISEKFKVLEMKQEEMEKERMEMKMLLAKQSEDLLECKSILSFQKEEIDYLTEELMYQREDLQAQTQFSQNMFHHMKIIEQQMQFYQSIEFQRLNFQNQMEYQKMDFYQRLYAPTIIPSMNMFNNTFCSEQEAKAEAEDTQGKMDICDLV
jgi:hypothetical protein